MGEGGGQPSRSAWPIHPSFFFWWLPLAIFIIKSEWHLYSCRPDKTSGKIVTTAKSSGRTNCDTLHNARHTHTRDTIVIETPNCENPPASNSQLCSGPLASKNENDWQLLLLTDSYYYEAAVVIINDWWLWHLCQARAGAQPHLLTLPSHHFFTNSLPMLESWHQKSWHDLVSNCTTQIFPLFAILVTFFLDGTSAFLDAPMNLQLSCRFYTGSVSMIDFQGKKRGRGNKNGQQKKGAGWRGSEGGTIARNINYTRDASWWTRWPKFSQTHAWAYVQQQETTKYMETKSSWKVGSSH